MIYNERQYKITSKQLAALQESLISDGDADEPSWLTKARTEAIESHILELKSELREYDLLKSGELKHYENSDLSSLSKALISARIGQGLSQEDLADKLGMTQQQIQRYEASNYMGASLRRLIEFASVLGVKVRESWGTTQDEATNLIYSWEDDSQVDWSKFPVKEMLKRGWIRLKQKQTVVDAVRDFFSLNAGMEYASALHRKKFFGSNRPNEYSLLAWQARILQKANIEQERGLIGEFNFNDDWVKDLKRMSLNADAPKLAKKLLADNGIALVLEPHLQGTYLDGAAMRSDSGKAIIALTLRHDRLDNFWFVLLHEIGHVYLHLFDSLHMDFFDEEGGGDSDQIEDEADAYALRTLIPDADWNTCMVSIQGNQCCN